MTNIADKEVDSWLFMSSPWPVISISTLYLLFVLKLGPSIMESRKPLSFKYTMLMYNAFQTLYNTWIFSLVRYISVIFCDKRLITRTVRIIQCFFMLQYIKTMS